MSQSVLLALLVGYFLVLMGIARLTGKKGDNASFFVGNRNNRWYIVAFGMIGTSLSGVTFISIPGTVQQSGFTYLQMALGYVMGYIVIAFVLLPVYYRLNLTSIYTYLGQRFGPICHQMGTAFFVVSRLIGAALRMYLVAHVLQTFVFREWGIPFWVTVALSIALIWIYTFKGGINTIVWTDTLQTLFMLVAVGVSVYAIAADANIALTDLYAEIRRMDMGTFWQTDRPKASNYWWKGLLGGLFITLGMTGVDQDMMQKNLSCKDQRDAQKNVLSFSVVLFFVNVLFVILGGVLFLHIDTHPDTAAQWQALNSDGDLLFAVVALKGGLGMAVGIFFLLGLIAAAYSSADSALTALTTSVAVDFLAIGTKPVAQQERTRRIVHILMSVALLITILLFDNAKDESVVWKLFKAANYTYGPLLGLFLFGIISKRKVAEKACLVVCLSVPSALYGLNEYLSSRPEGYQFGAELLGINALLVCLLLWLCSRRTAPKTASVGHTAEVLPAEKSRG